MTGVTVAEEKIAYLWECLEKYNGVTGFLVLYFVMLIFILIKGTQKERRIFIPMSILMVVTVFNPIFPMLLTVLTKIDSEYYRFFWITPVVVLVPYVLTKLILALLNGEIRHKKSVIVLSLLAFLLSSNSVFKSGTKLARNEYKMPEELIEISEIIHRDSTREYPKVFLEFDYNMQMRQYDPKILLTIDREDYLYTMTDDYTTEMIESDEKPQYRLLAAMIRYQNVDVEKVLDGLEMTDTEYVVLSKGSTMIPVLRKAGLKDIAETENHIILFYEQKEIEDFELVDYSGCYAEGI